MPTTAAPDAVADVSTATLGPTAAVPPPGVRLFGIRHHGPGSARSLVAALDADWPDIILIEGPPEAEALLSWVADPDLRPPVAFFAYETAEPANAAFWPFAVFSPEWQALTWASQHHVPVRFIDLPAATTLAQQAAVRQAAAAAEVPATPEVSVTVEAEEVAAAAAIGAPTEVSDPVAGTPGQSPEIPGFEAPDQAGQYPGDPAVPDDPDHARQLSYDPFAVLAEVAGIADPERWWDEVVESTPAGDRFTAVAQMMVQLRSEATARTDGIDPRDRVREARMRTILRQVRSPSTRVAVVCGAWHVPALLDPLPPAKADAALLRGLPKVKCEVAWVPWTHSRLAFASGYGAGVESPGWYHHLYTTADQPIVRWLTTVAAALRARDLPVSSAHIIEATRLAETLAALRGRALPGLGEVSQAVLAVLCDGDEALLAYIQSELVVGELLGTVPAGAPLVPLEADLRATAKTFRLAFSGVPKEITLDLRKDFDRRRSAFLHRLAILQLDWGTPRDESSTGTFKEAWTLTWAPEFAVRLVEAAPWGTTVETAAARRLTEDTETLAAASAAIERALVADLPQVLDQLLLALDARAAAEGDVEHLLGSVPPLARAHRYGTVRGTDTSQLAAVAESVLVRAAVGLAPAVAGLADEAVRHLAGLFVTVHQATSLLPPTGRATWVHGLRVLLDRRDAPSLLVGRAVRLLFDAGELDRDDLARRLSRALSGPDPALQAAWVEGFLSGDALLLIHDQRLLDILDRWVAGLSTEAFVDCLPLIRRSFGAFNRTDRRQLERRVLAAHNRAPADPSAGPTDLDFDRTAGVLTTVRTLLGWPPSELPVDQGNEGGLAA
jgi:hypothetical protein